MKNTLSILFLLALTSSCWAQTLDFKLFESSGGNVRKEVGKNQATYKQIRKEQQQYLKDQKKRYKQLSDSLNDGSTKGLLQSVTADSIKQLEALQQQYFIYTDTLYQLEELMAWDTVQTEQKQLVLGYAENKLEGNYYYEKYTGYNNQLLSYHKEYKQYKDSLKSAEMDKDTRDYLLEVKKGELSKKYNTALETQATQELQKRDLIPVHETGAELEELQKYNNLAAGLSASQLPTDVNTYGMEDLQAGDIDKTVTQGLSHFEGQEEVLESAMTSMQDLKKKYSTVLNSNDLSTATKRSSLKGSRLGQRLVFGGTFQIHIDVTTSIDLNPELAYLINKNFSAGIGGNYRLNSETVDVFNNTYKQSIYGYRVFTEHKIFRSFYGHVEFEALSMSEPSITTAENENSWYYSVLAGIERRIRISDKVDGQVTVLYNFMHKNNPAYGSPFSIRFGFNVKGLGKKE